MNHLHPRYPRKIFLPLVFGAGVLGLLSVTGARAQELASVAGVNASAAGAPGAPGALAEVTKPTAPVAALDPVAPASAVAPSADATPAAEANVAPGAPAAASAAPDVSPATGAAAQADTAAAAPAATDGAPQAASAPASPAANIDATAPAAGADGTVSAAAAEAMMATTPDQDLWGRIRRGFKMPDLDTKKAQNSTRWYAAQPDYIGRMTARASMYLYYIVEEIEKRGMPTELALLPFVESAMQPEAVSFAKAAGLWQFIPSTGRLYSLEQSLWKDERFGVTESTRAALDYLQKLYAEFGDWQLALAAYNCGEAGVERALARARKQHRSLAYKDLRLPNETQYYVPKLQAIKNIIADPQRFGIALPAIRNQPYFVAVSSADWT